MAEQKRRTASGIYQALNQIASEEGVDFGLNGVTEDQFKQKYFSRPEDIGALYDVVNGVSDNEGIDFGQGTREEWLASFGPAAMDAPGTKVDQVMADWSQKTGLMPQEMQQQAYHPKPGERQDIAVYNKQGEQIGRDTATVLNNGKVGIVSVEKPYETQMETEKPRDFYVTQASRESDMPIWPNQFGEMVYGWKGAKNMDALNENGVMLASITGGHRDELFNNTRAKAEKMSDEALIAEFNRLSQYIAKDNVEGYAATADGYRDATIMKAYMYELHARDQGLKHDRENNPGLDDYLTVSRRDNFIASEISRLENMDDGERRKAMAKAYRVIQNNAMLGADALGNETPETIQAKKTIVAGAAIRAKANGRPIDAQYKTMLQDIENTRDYEAELEEAQKELEDIQAMIDKRMEEMALEEAPKGTTALGKLLMSTPEETFIRQQSDPEIRKLTAALHDREEQIRILEAAKNGGGDFLSGLWDAVSNPNTLLMGVPGLFDTQAKLGYSSDQSRSSRIMMQSAAMTQLAHGRYDEQLSDGYSFGQLTGNMIPFAAQIAATGGYAGLADAVANLFPQSMRYLGVGLGELAAGWALANTVGMANTWSDAINRYLGDVHMDGSGNYYFDGGDPIWTAIYKAQMSQAWEYGSEGIGKHMHLGARMISGMNRLGAKRLSDMLTHATNSGFYQEVSAFMNRLGLQGLPEEGLEEEINMLASALFVGDNNFSLDKDSPEWKTSIFNPDVHKDIWEGMAVSMMFMGAVPTTIYGTRRGYYAQRYYHYQHAMEKAGLHAEQLLGDQWPSWQERIDGTDLEGVGSLLNELSANGDLSPKQKMSLFDYIFSLQKMRGYNLRKTGENAERAQNGDTANDVADDEQSRQFSSGYETVSPEERRAICDRLDAAAARLAKKGYSDQWMMWVANSSMEDIQSTLNERGLAGDLDAVTEYLSARAAFDGMLQRMDDDTDNEVAVANEQIDQRIAPEDQGGDGMIHPAVLKDGREVFIVSGNVATLADNSIDTENSDGMIIVRDAEGNPENITPNDIESLGEVQDPEQLRSDTEQAINEQNAQAAAAVIDGQLAFNPGDVYTINYQGEPHTYEIVQADENNVAVLVDGAQEPVVLTREQLQQMADEERAEQIQAQADEPIPGVGEEPATEEPSQSDDTVDQTAAPITEETPAAPDEPVAPEDNPTAAMPMDDQGEPAWDQVEPERGHQFLYQESGWPQTMADNFVQKRIDDAEKALTKAQEAGQKLIDNPKPTFSAQQQAVAENTAAQQAAQSALDYWKGVQDIQAAATAPVVEENAPVVETPAEQAPTEQAATVAETEAPAEPESSEPVEETPAVETPAPMAENEMQPVEEPTADNGGTATELSPEMKIVQEAKSLYPDEDRIVILRFGDHYEVYNQDAERLHEVMGDEFPVIERNGEGGINKVVEIKPDQIGKVLPAMVNAGLHAPSVRQAPVTESAPQSDAIPEQENEEEEGADGGPLQELEELFDDLFLLASLDDRNAEIIPESVEVTEDGDIQGRLRIDGEDTDIWVAKSDKGINRYKDEGMRVFVKVDPSRDVDIEKLAADYNKEFHKNYPTDPAPCKVAEEGDRIDFDDLEDAYQFYIEQPEHTERVKALKAEADARAKARNAEDVKYSIESQGEVPTGEKQKKFDIAEANNSGDPNEYVIYQGVYHDPSGYAVSTNGHILVADKRAYDEKNKGKLIASKRVKKAREVKNNPAVTEPVEKGQPIPIERYPNWKSVKAGKEGTETAKVDFKKFADWVAGVEARMKEQWQQWKDEHPDEKMSFNSWRDHSRIQIMTPDGRVRWFKFNDMQVFARAAADQGSKTLRFYPNNSDLALQAESKNGFVLMMPLHIGSDYERLVDSPYRIEGGLNIDKNGSVFTYDMTMPGKTDTGRVELNYESGKDAESRAYIEEVMEREGWDEEAKSEFRKILDDAADLVSRMAQGFSRLREWNNKKLTDEQGNYNPLWRVWDKAVGWIPNRSSFKKNGEYPYNIDLGALCTKREAFDAVVRYIKEQGWGQNLGPTQIEALKSLLREHGFLTACDICFNETKRARALDYGNAVAYYWNAVRQAVGIDDDLPVGTPRELTEEQMKILTALAASKNGKAFSKYIPKEVRRTYETYTNSKGQRKRREADKGLTPTMTAKVAKLFLQDPSLMGRFEGTTLLSTDSVDALVRQYPHTTIAEFIAGAWGSATPKPNEGFNIYDPLSWKQAYDKKRQRPAMDWFFNLGGFRAQSFSDYSPIFFYDYVQMFTDLAIRRLPIHIYTKVPALIKLFGGTGAKFNMSLVPEVVQGVDPEHLGLKPDGNGGWELAWHEDSFPVDEAFALRQDPRFNGNVGTIAVGISDAHIRMLLDDPRIDMVIPYHKSGMPKSVQIKTGLNNATDYTDDQKTKGKKKGLKDFSFNEALRRLGDPRKAADEYLAWCKQNKCTPKFPQFADHPNYYKVLEDFRCIDNEGNYSEQQPVRMSFFDDVEQRLSESLGDRTMQEGLDTAIRGNDAITEGIKKIMSKPRLDGKIRDMMLARLKQVLGKDNVASLKQEDFFEELQKVYTDQMGADRAQQKVEVLRTSGGIVYGFAAGNRVVLNENYFNAETPMHEFTHVWVKVARLANPQMWAEGKELLKQTKEWQEVMNDEFYSDIHGDEDAVASEVLARIVGQDAARQINEMFAPEDKPQERPGIYNKIKQWVNKFLDGVRSLFDSKANGLTYDELVRMPMKALFDDTEAARFMEALAQVNEEEVDLSSQGSVPTFYSNAAKAVENVKQNKATAEQWKAMLTKAGGIKAGEDKWMGLSTWLDEHKGETLTKDEVRQFVAENGIEMEERNYGDKTSEINKRLDDFANEFDSIVAQKKGEGGKSDVYDEAFADMVEKYGEDFDMAFMVSKTNFPESSAILVPVREYGGELSDAAKYFLGVDNQEDNLINKTRLDYTTPGLENKREIAFVVPGVEPYQEGDEIHFGPENQGRAVMWVRFGETTDTEGNRVLVIDEIQSNRHQDAREKGYKKPIPEDAPEVIAYNKANKEYQDYLNGLREKYGQNLAIAPLTKEEQHRKEELTKVGIRAAEGRSKFYEANGLAKFDKGIPTAPFEKNWHEVAMKRMLRLAAEEGFDKVAWTTGAQQAERYSLGGVIDSIYIAKSRRDNSKYAITVFDKNADVINTVSKDYTPQELADTFGKDMAQRLIDGEAKQSSGNERYLQYHIEGVDLEVGREGMKAFYDGILPQFMNKYGKRWGVKTGEVTLNTPGGETMHSVDVTPEMRRSVMTEGQPLFQIKSLGAPYQGSKGQIATRIVDALPSGKRFVDLFSGGGAVTHAAMLSGKYEGYRMNDINPAGQELFLAGMRGDYRDYQPRELTAEEFKAIKGTPEGLLLSYSGLGRNVDNDKESVARRLRRVQRLEELKPYADQVEPSNTDYREVQLQPGDVVYADIPYEGTNKTGYREGAKFDKQAFSDWALGQDVPIYVSEQSMPEGWVEVQSWDMKAMRGKTRGEKLFVQAKFAGDGGNATAHETDQTKSANFKRWFGDWENDPENASKVVDKDGKPLVVYHQTNAKRWINRETGEDWEKLDWRKKMEWESRTQEEWEDAWEEQDFYTFDDRYARQSIEMPAIFFSPENDPHHEYGNRTIAVYLNMRNPAINPDIPNRGVTDTAGRDAMEALKAQGYDGFIRTDEDGNIREYGVFDSNQVKSADEVTFDDDGNEIPEEERYNPDEQDIRYRELDEDEDAELIDRLENGPHITTYSTKIKSGDGYVPPMSSKDNETGEMRAPEHEQKWNESEERPDLAKQDKKTGKWKFDLKKSNDKDVNGVLYNPYNHSGSGMLNDQFSEAQDRDDLVVVEQVVPQSEETDKYKAEKANDPTGWKAWKAGPITAKMTGKRKVFLSRWHKITRVVPWSEVADAVAKDLGNQFDVLPTNPFPPQLRNELEDRGYKFVKTDNKCVIQEGEYKGATWSERYYDVYPDRAKSKDKKAKGARAKAVKEQNTKELFDYAKKRFGVTTDFREAGYILPDGTMLDFSGRHELNEGDDSSFLKGRRTVDHSYVSNELSYQEDGWTPTGIKTSMTDFIERGAIRINGPSSINLAVKPTKEQAATLRRYLAGKQFALIDFGNGDTTEHYAAYGDDIDPNAPAIRSSRVLADIDRYFDDGIKPEGTARYRDILEDGGTLRVYQREGMGWQNVDEVNLREDEGEWVFNRTIPGRFESRDAALDALLAYSQREGLQAHAEPGGSAYTLRRRLPKGKKWRVEGVPGEFDTQFGAVDNARNFLQGHVFEVAEDGNSIEVLGAGSNLDALTGRGEAATQETATDAKPLTAKQRKAEERARKWRERTVENGRRRVEELGQRLGVKVTIVDDMSEQEREGMSKKKRRAKGWYDVRTGEVFINLGNHKTVSDIEATFLHEVVAHKGLRRLFGDEFDTFLHNVYYNVDASIREEINRLMAKNNWDYREATEEYLAKLAQQMNFERPEKYVKAWETVARLFRTLLQKMGLGNGMNLKDSDLQGILFESYHNMEKEGVAGLAESVEFRDAMEREANRGNATAYETAQPAVAAVASEPNGDQTKEDREYMEAVESGDMAKASRMVMEAAKSAMPYTKIKDKNGNPVVLYHGTFLAKTRHSEYGYESIDDEPFYVFETNSISQLGAHFGTRRQAENRAYSIGLDASNDHITGEEYLYSVYLDINNPIELTDRGKFDFEHIGRDLLEDGYITKEEYDRIASDIVPDRAMKELLKSKGYDGAVYFNEYEGFGISVIAFEPNQIKSAEAVTRDDNGNVIPLSERFNPENPDIRFRDDEDELEDFEDSEDFYEEELEEEAANAEDLGEEVDDSEAGPSSFQEMMLGKMLQAANSAGAAQSARVSAMRSLGGALQQIRKAMSTQRNYDRETVNTIVRLAREVMGSGYFNDLTRGEVKRLLAAAKNANGSANVTEQANKVVDTLLRHHLRECENLLKKQLKVKGSKENASGVEVQAGLDIEGQRMTTAMKQGMRLDEQGLSDRVADCLSRMGSSDPVVSSVAAQEYTGLMLAQQYHDTIKASRQEEQQMREEMRQAKEEFASRRDSLSPEELKRQRQDLKDYIAATEDAIRQNRMERADAYNQLSEMLGGGIASSMERAKQWREQQRERVGEIQHNANSDLEGVPADEHMRPTWKHRMANWSVVRFFMKPLATFDYMLRMMGQKNPNGEGYLWNRFMGGWVEANDKEFRNIKAAHKVLDEKVKEVFNADRPGLPKFKLKRWSDLFFIERKMKGMDVDFWDGDEIKTHTLTPGNLLYIYMVNKMSDGKMKLRKMGISEEDVDAIRDHLDPRLIELADWLQDEFLVQKRTEYNAVHERMFGAPMAAIENYFPLKINSRSRSQEEDVNNQDANPDDNRGSTITGAIIKRVRNNKALDLTGADAFDVILEHIQNLEHWAAYAEFNRDLNTLLSYKRFRNRILNMASARFGAGKKLWTNFKRTCAIASGVYRPKVDYDSVDTNLVNVAKGVTRAKISFRFYTAFKQLLSYPAYLSTANPIELIKSSNPVGAFKAWNWALEELPGFAERWQSRQAGDTRLKESDADWGLWKSKIIDTASRWGMSPNAFVDALTVAMGAKAIYETRFKQLKKLGYTEEQAKQRALRDASVAYNETQQSSANAYTSAMQLDRTAASVALTVFRNASMGYQRRLFQSFANLKHMATKGYREQSLEYLAKQMERDGLDHATAEAAAKKVYNRAIYKNIADVAIFGWVMQAAWNLGAYLPYLLLGDDDDDKDKMWDDALLHAIAGGIEGLTGGSVMSDTYNTIRSGEANMYANELLPLLSDMESLKRTFKKDVIEGANDLINLIIQAGVGVNPQTITDWVVAGLDAVHGDPRLANEYGLLVMRIMSAPQGQLDKLYIDELGLTAGDARKLNAEEFAQRYARYKMGRESTFTGWAYSDEGRNDAFDRYVKNFDKKLKERIDAQDIDVLADAYDRGDGHMKGLIEKSIKKKIAELDDTALQSMTSNNGNGKITKIVRSEINKRAKAKAAGMTPEEFSEFNKRVKASVANASDEELRDMYNQADTLARKIIRTALDESIDPEVGDPYKSPNKEYGRIYNRIKTADDMEEDILLAKAQKVAKAAGDDDLAKEIASARSELTEYRKELTGGAGDAQVMKELREARKELINEYVKNR